MKVVTVSSWLNFGHPAPREVDLRRVEIFGSALLQPARSVCVSLSAFSFWFDLQINFWRNLRFWLKFKKKISDHSKYCFVLNMTDDGNLHLASEFVITTHENYLLQGRRIVKPVLKKWRQFLFLSFVFTFQSLLMILLLLLLREQLPFDVTVQFVEEMDSSLPV